jgi:hypothetical protein
MSIESATGRVFWEKWPLFSSLSRWQKECNPILEILQLISSDGFSATKEDIFSSRKLKQCRLIFFVIKVESSRPKMFKKGWTANV